MKYIKFKESVLQKDFRMRLPKEIVQFGYSPGVDFFDVCIDNTTGNIILKKSKSGRINNYGKNK